MSVSATRNRITDPGYSYDANGNMTQDGLNSLTYDAENWLVSATGAKYSYDGAGLRVKKQVGSNPATINLFSGTKVIAEYAAGAAPSSPSKECVLSFAGVLNTKALTV